MKAVEYLSDNGRSDDADRALGRCIQLLQRESEPGSQAAAMLMALRGSLLEARGKWMGAEAMFRQAADICAAQLGRTHGLTVSVLLHLLGAQMQLGSSEGMERAAALSKALLPAAKEAWCAATEPPASGQA
mmetsp:Transcript_39698/g.94240  ORF Transcript_39698/g.94240 Transcript_39698/m.94240 type:complete len:131 (+) Transcript_39698:228-620(+)